MSSPLPLSSFNPARLNSKEILLRLNEASRQLAELKGLVRSMPHQGILISTLGLQEAKDSSAIENIVTTHDELFRYNMYADEAASPATKEVAHYRKALWTGYEEVKSTGLLTSNLIAKIQSELESNRAGFRKLPGTSLKNSLGEVVYTPPPPDKIPDLMTDLELFINTDKVAIDPILKMAIIHHQFESIHPFYDGNGRTGRIINVLYLVQKNLLNLPLLYLSRYIVRTKPDYYRLLQAVRDDDAWEEWVSYMLIGVEQIARESIELVSAINELVIETKHTIRDRHRFYSQDLINNLFRHPYTKIEYLVNDLGVTRLTATRYLNELKKDGLLEKQKIGRSNYYINLPLYQLLTSESLSGGEH